jgi:hypothetical protein
MGKSGLKTKLKAADLEAAIAIRLAKEPECAGIFHVYIKATGKEPPEDTRTHTLISRRTTVPRTTVETKALHDVLNEMRKEFDLLPDYSKRCGAHEVGVGGQESQWRCAGQPDEHLACGPTGPPSAAGRGRALC